MKAGAYFEILLPKGKKTNKNIQKIQSWFIPDT